ncbi:MAG TPA: hypothetical protein ENN99_08885 [Chloroflexi bacterium]|nr:hypothetical protein [Chloroflexota bacterium]
MASFIKRWIPFILFAALPGIVVLLAYLVPAPALLYFRDRLVDGAVIVAAFAFLLGLFNLLRVHGGQVLRRRQGWFYSLVLVAAMLAFWIPPAFRDLPWGMAVQETLGLLDRMLFEHIISPLGASLAALVVFTLILAAFRLLRTRRSAGSAVFLLVVAVVLLGGAPLIGLEWLTGLRDWIVHVFGMAGMRGLLLGVALGTVITALRVFIASERPYSEL